MIVDVINEGSTHYIQADFLDKDGNPVVPDSILYRVDCVTNNVSVEPETNYTPLASSVEIKIPSAAIIDPANGQETKRITITAGINGELQTHEQDWIVKNLAFV